jgi:succinyl-CoA synthetase alpha subunit
MGHAGAIVMGDKGSYASKHAALSEAGVHMLDTPSDVGKAMARALHD